MGPGRLMSIMSTRYRYREFDGDSSNPSSALEFAIDQHWYVLCKIMSLIFLLFNFQHHISIFQRISGWLAQPYITPFHRSTYSTTSYQLPLAGTVGAGIQ
jgi:hypothetical protein